MGSIAGWVTERVVILVATDTNLIPLPFQHCRICCTVQLMTVKTAFSMGVEVKTLLPPLELSGMAITADLPRITTDQPCLLTGVGSMAVKAERPAGT
jgi:hypothetical protein